MSARWSRRALAVIAGLSVVGAVLSGCSAGPSIAYETPHQADGELPSEVVAQLEAAVTEAMVASGATGAIVGVWAPWSGSWVAGLGTQTIDGAPVTPDMAFRIADVTRLMTCDVLYSLADHGTLELDAPVPDYVSSVPKMQQITLVDLCNSTSGYGSSEAATRGIWYANPDRIWGGRELAAYGLGQPPSAEPGTVFRDSDAGYRLLGLALERATHTSASSLYEQYVFEPLALADTALPSPASAPPSAGPSLQGHYLPPMEGGGYDCLAPIDITRSSSSIGYTDSGVVSTISDLGRYMRAEAAQALRAADASPDRFGNPLPAYDGAPSWYQYTGGAFLVGSMIGQAGWVPGYATAAYSDPETGFTVAVVLNDSTLGRAIVNPLAWELAALASKVPAAPGESMPEFGLPFTAEEYRQQILAAAICQPPADVEGESTEG